MSKPKTPKRKHKVIWVLWNDARSDYSEFLTADKIPNHCYLESGGIFIKEDADRVYFALDFMHDGETYRDIQSIPKCNIVEYKIHDVV